MTGTVWEMAPSPLRLTCSRWSPSAGSQAAGVVKPVAAGMPTRYHSKDLGFDLQIKRDGDSVWPVMVNRHLDSAKH